MVLNNDDFIGRWISFLYSQVDPQVIKNWSLAEKQPSYILVEQAYSDSVPRATNVISFPGSPKTFSQSEKNKEICRQVNTAVTNHCINTSLSLPGFYAFLREIQQIQTAIVDDEKLEVACADLITGYWERVKPGVGDFGEEVTPEDITALHHIRQAAKELSSDKANDLDPKLPFTKAMKRVHAELNIPTRKPGSTPTFSPG